jgi:hypothetical protein
MREARNPATLFPITGLNKYPYYVQTVALEIPFPCLPLSTLYLYSPLSETGPASYLFASPLSIGISPLLLPLGSCPLVAFGNGILDGSLRLHWVD